MASRMRRLDRMWRESVRAGLRRHVYAGSQADFRCITDLAYFPGFSLT